MVFEITREKMCENNEDNTWVFDSLVCFLNGPIWNAPLQSFVEEKSLIFEPTITDNEEYKKIFDEFKNLVDFMLGNFMDDIGITPEQFHDACLEGKKCRVSFDHNLFEQIWAANDYEMFIRMMTQRNVELQLQALELIESKYGITPQSFIPRKAGDNESQVRKIPVTIEKEPEFEKKVLQEVSKKFTEEIASTSKEEMQHLIEQKPILEKHLLEALEKTEKSEQPDVVQDKAIIQKEEENTAHFLKNEGKITKSEKTSLQIDPLELKKRQEYLRSQRDKLIALKKEARQKQLTDENGSKDVKTRPKSAKGAEAILTGEKPSMDDSQLQIRKTLAEKLKSEVVEKGKK